MKKFKVLASYTSYCTIDIEAENEDQAWELARDMDGGSFEPVRGWDGEWHISDVREVN